jgi:hypoxanthine phosphoribosyltransferase
MQDRSIYSWEDFDRDVVNINNQIIYSNWLPDYVVGVKRGGLIPAIKLSHILQKPMIIMSYQSRNNEDNSIKLLEVESIPKNKNVLIVDDICDSGVTFHNIIDKFISEGFQSIKTCSLYYNNKQPFVVDYRVNHIDRNTDSRWIIFPWEVP